MSPLAGFNERVDWLLALVGDELVRATEKSPGFSSPHEGKAAIEGELNELRQHVEANGGTGTGAMIEALGVAAMALRYVHDLAPDWGPPARAADSQAQAGA